MNKTAALGILACGYTIALAACGGADAGASAKTNPGSAQTPAAATSSTNAGPATVSSSSAGTRAPQASSATGGSIGTASVPTAAIGGSAAPTPSTTPPASAQPATPPAAAGAVASNPAPTQAMPTPAAANPPAMPAGPTTPKGDKTCLQAGSGNYGEPGPYKVGMMDVDLGMINAGQHTGKFTIYYPMPLEAACLHPIVAWGNGTGVMDSTTYAFFTSNAASWGMVVAAAQEDNAGSGNFHKAGIDYLLKQNADAGSMFYKKLSTRAGVAGHSQGGFGATVATQHANVEAVVSVAGGGVPKQGVATLCLTGTKDQVEAQCTQEYQAASGPAFLGDWMDGDHFVTETLAGYIQRDMGSLQMQRLLAGWFRCWLADDAAACALFKGAPTSCGICKDPGWAKREARNM